MRRSHQLHLSRGVGLLDALIAMAILTFGLLALTRMQARMMAQSTESQSRQIATQLADELLSTVLVDVRNAACYTLPQTGTCGSAKAKAATTDWAERTAKALPGTVTTASDVDSGTGRLTLVISWTGRDTGNNRTEPRRLKVITDVRP